MDICKREIFEKPCTIRSEFQRDKDRIIHSKSFRRLMNKTQVFIAPKGDHYRTRLTHTLEVSQIARTIARATNLNEDLTEAIALGHDLGHTPFGHIGEDALNELSPSGFSHNKQSLRVVTKLENYGRGLNLCLATNNGILCHSGSYFNDSITKEGKIVNISDRIAYINHDIDDALRAKILKVDDLPKDLLDILGKSHSERINTLVISMINYIKTENEVGLYAEVNNAMLKLRQFMFQNVYLNKTARGEEEKAHDIVKYLYEYYVKNPEKIPSEYCDENKEQNVTDYISGMTDRYAIDKFKDLFVPKNFGA